MTALQDVLDTGAVDAADVAYALDISTRTVSRWRHDPADDRIRRATLDRLLELKAVIDLALQVMSSESAATWLRSPVPALNYDKPLDLIRDGEFRRVIDALAALAEGVCS